MSEVEIKPDTPALDMNNESDGQNKVQSEAKCPFNHGAVNKPVAGNGTSNRDWWPNQLKVNILRQHSSLSNPMEETFNYAKEFKSLDLAAVKKDLFDLMTTSQDWWPSDYGTYAGLFIRMHGIVQVRTGSPTVGVALVLVRNVLHHSTVGLIMQTLIRPVYYYGLSNRSMVKKFPGLI